MTSSPKPSRKLLAIAGALSVVAGSFAPRLSPEETPRPLLRNAATSQ